MNEFQVLSPDEYARMRKIRQEPRSKPHVGRNQRMILAFWNGSDDHALIKCTTYRAAVIRRNSLEATIARLDLPIKVQQRRENILLSKI